MEGATDTNFSTGFDVAPFAEVGKEARLVGEGAGGEEA